MDIRELLSIAYTRKASDLHLVVAFEPAIRVFGELHSLVTFPILTTSDVEQMVFSLLTPLQKETLVNNKELDFSTSYQADEKNSVRFRVNAYYQSNSLAASFRLIPSAIKTIDELGLPSLVHEFTKLRQGFVLLTGGSGQGKSTTIASIIDEINRTRSAHIVTIEDPVEYIYKKQKAIISQREMFGDTHSFRNALKSVLREDPDVLYVGEMRDLETIATTLTIAETGHLVFSTLHTNSAAQSIDRIIDIFPPSAKEQVKLQLSMVLSAVVTQRLVPSLNGGRVPVCEILLGTPSIKNTIREGKTHLIDNIIQTSTEAGMMIFEEHLKQLVEQNIISHETALEYALRPDRYLQLIKG